MDLKGILIRHPSNLNWIVLMWSFASSSAQTTKCLTPSLNMCPVILQKRVTHFSHLSLGFCSFGHNPYLWPWERIGKSKGLVFGSALPSPQQFKGASALWQTTPHLVSLSLHPTNTLEQDTWRLNSVCFNQRLIPKLSGTIHLFLIQNFKKPVLLPVAAWSATCHKMNTIKYD